MKITNNNLPELSEDDELALIELLDISARQYEAGNCISHEELKEIVKTWKLK